jgi:hypothetical protein
MHTLILIALLASPPDFVIPLPRGGWATGDSFIMPTPGGGWAWEGGFAAPLPGGGYGGYGFDRLPGFSPVAPWGLERQPRYPGCDPGIRRLPRTIDPWAERDSIIPYPYSVR